jgi:hypothetical protein
MRDDVAGEATLRAGVNRRAYVGGEVFRDAAGFDRLPSRIGVLTEGRFVFTCASCDGTAATLRTIQESGPIDFGLGPNGAPLILTVDAPARLLDFINVSSGPLTPDVANLLIGPDSVDPLKLRAIEWDLAVFCCRGCDVNYCRSCWTTWVEFADDYPGFYDSTRGRCPRGHEQMLDD